MSEEIDLAKDRRWRRLWENPWTCRGCGQTHQGLFDLAYGKPAQYPGSEDKAPNSALVLRGNFLSEDFCVLDGRHFFVRAVLEIPIRSSGGRHFGFGVWSTLSRDNFVRYLETFDSGEQAGLGPWFGWFSNRLEAYPDTLSLKCQVHPRGGRQRPRVVLEPTSHPLSEDQQIGVTFDRLLELYAISGHDIRGSLSD